MVENTINEDVLKEGGRLTELFALRPVKYADKIATVRLKINKKWSGWKLRDELISGLGLQVGNTIATSVTVQYTDDLSTDVHNLDLFATGESCDWLLDNKVSAGSIIDCQVRFSYVKVPVGLNDKNVFDASLVFVKGLGVIENGSDCNESCLESDLLNLLQTITENE